METSEQISASPEPMEPLIGAHESIAGGIHLAFGRAERAGCRTLQVFTKNASQWRAKPLSESDIGNYKTAASKSTIAPVVAHDSYLINLCARDPDLRKRSLSAFVDELQRCQQLGIPYLNFHPGAHMGQGEDAGIARIIEALNEAHMRTPHCPVMSVVETTAGQGTVLGCRFEQIRMIVEGVADRSRMGVCIDTCHIFAAGYDLRSPEAYASTMKEFGDIVGFERLVALHINDSKGELGSRRDRHEHIGEGYIGVNGFRNIMTDDRLRKIPKILETPKGEDLREDMINLRLLRRLARPRRAREK